VSINHTDRPLRWRPIVPLGEWLVIPHIELSSTCLLALLV
jgi:hypothetical protein